MATPPPLPASSPRADIFRQLKPVCVRLSQITIRSQDGPDTNQVLRLLDVLNTLWTEQASNDAGVLDAKLAEYVFFPLSHLLRSQDRYPIRVIEATIRLITSLIRHGWKAALSRDLALQFLLFFSFTISGVPGDGQRRREVPEETVIQGYRAIDTLLTATGSSISILPSSQAQQRDDMIPALGHSLTVVLDGITVGIPTLIQLEALQSLQAFFTTIRDNCVLAKFLPGTVSTLSRFLSTALSHKVQKRVITRCLHVLKLVLVTVVGDIKIRGILQKMKDTAQSGEQQCDKPATSDKSGTELTPAWLKATASQIKMALSSVLKLRAHDAEEVLSALDELCIALLDECHSSLADCQSILVESAMVVESYETEKSLFQTGLQDLAAIYPELANIIKSTLYNWITGLPRHIQSNDDRVQKLAIRSLLRGMKLAAALHIDSSTLDESLGNSLRDCVVSLIRDSKPCKVLDDIEAEGRNFLTSSPNTELSPYHPVLLDLEGQKTTRAEINTLVSNVGSSTQQIKLASAMLGSLRDLEGVDQLASFWLSFELLKATYSDSAEMDELIDLSSFEESKDQENVFRELFDFSASVLSSCFDSEDHDWRLVALALEVTAFAASRLKEEFRPELIDILYPVTACLGSPTPQLRRHAICTLDRLALSCGYGSLSELIIGNVDYMVNSISLRLNTFDISPASTKVLTMMIRLTGPRLLPYLDDVTTDLFAALHNYHGYPAFVESLFSVLAEMVNQGTRSDTLLLETSKPVDHGKRKLQSGGIAGILETLEQRTRRAKRLKAAAGEEQQDPSTRQGHPTEPWGPDKSQAKSLLDKLDPNIPDEEDKDADNNETPNNEAAENPDSDKLKTPTYTLLSRIMSLTQHYLTSPTPTLRKSLLDLVATAGPALASDENALLPLVNTLWPVVISRLQDPEPFVVVAACKALAAMCLAAGDFLSSRFKTEWYSGSGGGGASNLGLGRWFERVKAEARKIRRNHGGGGGAAVRSGGPNGNEILFHSVYETGTGLGNDEININIGASGGQKLVQNLTSLPITHKNNNPLSLSSSSSSTLLSSPSPAAATNRPTPSASTTSVLGRFSQASLVWDAAISLITAIVTYTKIDDDMYDEILDLVVDVAMLPEHEDLRHALEAVNPDGIWLALYKRGKVAVVSDVVPRGVVVSQLSSKFEQVVV